VQQRSKTVAAMAIALASLALSGCLGQAPAPGPPSAPAVATPEVPAALRPMLAAFEAGQPLPLQSLVAHAEKFRGLPSDTVAAPPRRDVVEALLGVLELDGVPVSPAMLAELQALLGLPADLRDAVAVLARATVASSHMARAAFEPAHGLVTEGNAGDVDWALALQALRLKLAAVDAALPVLQAHAGGLDAGPVVDICGSLAIDAGSDAHTYACNYTLLLDLGGDDTYLGNAGGTHTIYASPLHIDVAGNDRYLSRVVDHTAVTGGAVSGVGTLIDVQGDDTYDTSGEEGSGQNGGVQGGVGFLADLGGKDLVKATGLLHSGVNGAAWIGHGTLLLQGGDDEVRAWTEGAGSLNGAGLLGTGLVVGLGGSRIFHAEDGGQPFGGAANGAGVGGGLGTLLDRGGDTRYEALMGGRSASANGGGRAGFGVLMDLGGGDDAYLARAAEGSALNGRGLDATGLLFDDGGTDTYTEVPGASATDATVMPKGWGAQIDGSRPLPAAVAVPAAAAVRDLAPWPEAARPVARALVQAHEAGFSVASLEGLVWALSAMPGDVPHDALPAPAALPVLVARFLADRGATAPASGLAELAGLPADLQGALATLLAAYVAADDLVQHMPLPPAGAAPGPDALRARAMLLDAVEAARPTLAKYAGRTMGSGLDVCGVLDIDLTGSEATYVCNYAFQVTLGGASTYRNNAGGSVHGGSGFLVDVAGDDHYDGDLASVWYGVAGGAAGVTGLGFLADLAGDDDYAPACVQGCSAMGGADSGTGALVDYAGNDHYMVDAGLYSAATGGGIVGRGFLADLAGNDMYIISGPQHTTANGGAIFGTGFLFDKSGDDLYHVATGEHGPVNGAAIIGAGMLLDMGGNDVYHAEAGHHAMVNGAAFWAAPGAFLIDATGDDSYTAVSGMEPFANGRYWYPGECPLPRTGCTRGVATLVDLGGHDAYLEWNNGMGGHDHHHGENATGMPAQDPAQGCAPPPGHENHTHEHACQPDCAPPPGHEGHTHGHTCASAEPPPKYDETVLPKGDSGAQIDEAFASFEDFFRAAAGMG